MNLGTMSYHDLPTSAPAGDLKYVGSTAEEYDGKREPSDKWKVEQKIIEGMLSELPRGARVLDCPIGTGRFLQAYVERGLLFDGVDISGEMLYKSAVKAVGRTNAKTWIDKCDAWVAKFIEINSSGQPILDQKGNYKIAGKARITLNDEVPPFDQPLMLDGKPILIGIDNEKVKPLVINNENTLRVGDVRSLGAPDRCVDAALNIRITRWISPEECQQVFREMQRVSRDRIIVTARVTYPNHPELARPLALFESVMGDDWVLEKSEAGYVPEYRIFQFRNKRSPFLAQKNIIIETVKAADEAGDGHWTMKPYGATK